MADIFLSYAREDEARARVVAGLESRGWCVFWDRRIPTGHDFGEYIQQQINTARCIVVLWSKASVLQEKQVFTKHLRLCTRRACCVTGSRGPT